MSDCQNCDGCGKIANDEDGTPWTVWESLPLKSSAAVLMGLIRPIPCPVCDGTGLTGGHKQPAAQENAMRELTPERLEQLRRLGEWDAGLRVHPTRGHIDELLGHIEAQDRRIAELERLAAAVRALPSDWWIDGSPRAPCCKSCGAMVGTYDEGHYADCPAAAVLKAMADLKETP